MEADIVMMIAMATATVLIVNQLGRILRAMMLHRTIRKGIEHNNTLTPELFDKIEEQRARAAASATIASASCCWRSASRRSASG